MITALNLEEKFSKINQHWTPKVIGELNGQHIKLAKVQGEFVWHSHEAEDELFMIHKGTLFMDFRDKTIEVKTGEIIIVPKGVEHRPRTKAGEEVWIMLFEPIDTKHTGEVEHEKTVKKYEWI